MNKATSETLIGLRQEVVEKYGVDDWGVTYVDGRWLVGFLKDFKRYVGHGQTPQEAYEAAVYDIESSNMSPS